MTNLTITLIDHRTLKTGTEFRTEQDSIALADLIQSINEPTPTAQTPDKRAGLIYPLHVQDNGDGSYTVLIGGRRARALRAILSQAGASIWFEGEKLPAGKLPVFITTADDLYHTQVRQLHENIKRLPLSPADEARAVAKLATLHRQRFGTPHKEVIESVANELGKKPSVVAIELAAAELLTMETPTPSQQITIDALEGANSTRIFHKIMEKADPKAEARAAVLNHHAEVSTMARGHKILSSHAPLTCIYDVGILSTPDNWETDLPILSNLLKSDSIAFVPSSMTLFAKQADFLIKQGFNVYENPLIQISDHGKLVKLGKSSIKNSYSLWLFAFRGNRSTLACPSDVFTSKTHKVDPFGEPIGQQDYLDLLSYSLSAEDLILNLSPESGAILGASHLLKATCTLVQPDQTKRLNCQSRLKTLK